MRTLIVTEGDVTANDLYGRALQHVTQSYQAVFSSEIALHPQRLVITLARDGNIACAATIRRHDEGFFSQHYLDEPVSDLLTRQTGLPVAPTEVLEVGGFASTSPFPAYPALRAIFDWGRAQGIDWGLFTATAEIRRLIRRARITPLMLARADATRVPDPSQWGSYYEHDPWVCAFRDPAQMPGDTLVQAATA